MFCRFDALVTLKWRHIPLSWLGEVTSAKEKENNLLKVSLPNEVIYLKIKEISKIDPLNIKQNIVNLIYSTIINEITNNWKNSMFPKFQAFSERAVI